MILEVKKLEKLNPYNEVWRWQNYMFEKQITNTLKDARIVLKNFEKEFNEEFEKFNFQII